MKKRYIILLVTISILSLFFAGCGKATAVKKLSFPVYDAEAEKGKLSMEALSYQEKILKINVINNTSESVFLGEDYAIQKKTPDGWVDVEPIEDFSWIDLACIVEPGKSQEFTCDLSYYGDLEEGDYRLVKNPEITLEFEVIWQ